MLNFITNFINGALGVREEEYIPPEEQEFPEDGIIYTPEFPINPVVVTHSSNPAGPECSINYAVGDSVRAGSVIAEIHLETMILEIPAPCDAVIEEILLLDNKTIEPGDPIVKLR